MCAEALDPLGPGCQRWRMRRSLFIVAGLVFFAALGQAKDFYVHEWTKIHANKHFWAEGGAVGDFNRDGHGDLVVGPYWYAGPDFKTKHEIYPAAESFEMKNKAGVTVKVPGFPRSDQRPKRLLS